MTLCPYQGTTWHYPLLRFPSIISCKSSAMLYMCSKTSPLMFLPQPPGYVATSVLVLVLLVPFMGVWLSGLILELPTSLLHNRPAECGPPAWKGGGRLCTSESPGDLAKIQVLTQCFWGLWLCISTKPPSDGDSASTWATLWVVTCRGYSWYSDTVHSQSILAVTIVIPARNLAQGLWLCQCFEV